MRAWVRWVTLHQRTLPVGSSSFAVEILYHLEIIDKSSHTHTKNKKKFRQNSLAFICLLDVDAMKYSPRQNSFCFFLHFPFCNNIQLPLLPLPSTYSRRLCLCYLLFPICTGIKRKKKTQVSHSFFRLIRRIDRTTAVHCRFVTEFHSPLHCNAIPSPYSSSYTNVTQCRRRCRRRRVLYSRVVCQIAVLTSVSWIRTRRI